MPEREFNCPNCGAALKASLAFTKLVTCDYCDSAVFLEDKAVSLAGKQGVMTQVPSLIELGGTYRYRDHEFQVVGQVRFDYAHGFWDEYWSLVDGDGRWVSVDEGDIAVEWPIDINTGPAFEALKVGAPIELLGESFTVTEIGEAVCSAIKGELPELLEVGQRFRYAHLRGIGVRLVTLEYDKTGFAASDGAWVDPFEIKAVG